MSVKHFTCQCGIEFAAEAQVHAHMQMHGMDLCTEEQIHYEMGLQDFASPVRLQMHENGCERNNNCKDNNSKMLKSKKFKASHLNRNADFLSKNKSNSVDTILDSEEMQQSPPTNNPFENITVTFNDRNIVSSMSTENTKLSINNFFKFINQTISAENLSKNGPKSSEENPYVENSIPVEDLSKEGPKSSEENLYVENFITVEDLSEEGLSSRNKTSTVDNSISVKDSSGKVLRSSKITSNVDNSISVEDSCRKYLRSRQKTANVENPKLSADLSEKGENSRKRDSFVEDSIDLKHLSKTGVNTGKRTCVENSTVFETDGQNFSESNVILQEENTGSETSESALHSKEYQTYMERNLDNTSSVNLADPEKVLEILADNPIRVLRSHLKPSCEIRRYLRSSRKSRKKNKDIPNCELELSRMSYRSPAHRLTTRHGNGSKCSLKSVKSVVNVETPSAQWSECTSEALKSLPLKKRKKYIFTQTADSELEITECDKPNVRNNSNIAKNEREIAVQDTKEKKHGIDVAEIYCHAESKNNSTKEKITELHFKEKNIASTKNLPKSVGLYSNEAAYPSTNSGNIKLLIDNLIKSMTHKQNIFSNAFQDDASLKSDIPYCSTFDTTDPVNNVTDCENLSMPVLKLIESEYPNLNSTMNKRNLFQNDDDIFKPPLPPKRKMKTVAQKDNAKCSTSDPGKLCTSYFNIDSKISSDIEVEMAKLEHVQLSSCSDVLADETQKKSCSEIIEKKFKNLLYTLKNNQMTPNYDSVYKLPIISESESKCRYESLKHLGINDRRIDQIWPGINYESEGTEYEKDEPLNLSRNSTITFDVEKEIEKSAQDASDKQQVVASSFEENPKHYPSKINSSKIEALLNSMKKQHVITFNNPAEDGSSPNERLTRVINIENMKVSLNKLLKSKHQVEDTPSKASTKDSSERCVIFNINSDAVNAVDEDDATFDKIPSMVSSNNNQPKSSFTNSEPNSSDNTSKSPSVNIQTKLSSTKIQAKFSDNIQQKSFSNSIQSRFSSIMPKSSTTNIHLQPQSFTNIKPRSSNYIQPKSSDNIPPKSSNNIPTKSDNIPPKSDNIPPKSSCNNIQPKSSETIQLKTSTTIHKNILPKSSSTSIPQHQSSNKIQPNFSSHKIQQSQSFSNTIQQSQSSSSTIQQPQSSSNNVEEKQDNLKSTQNNSQTIFYYDARILEATRNYLICAPNSGEKGGKRGSVKFANIREFANDIKPKSLSKFVRKRRHHLRMRKKRQTSSNYDVNLSETSHNSDTDDSSYIDDPIIDSEKECTKSSKVKKQKFQSTSQKKNSKSKGKETYVENKLKVSASDLEKKEIETKQEREQPQSNFPPEKKQHLLRNKFLKLRKFLEARQKQRQSYTNLVRNCKSYTNCKGAPTVSDINVHPSSVASDVLSQAEDGHRQNLTNKSLICNSTIVDATLNGKHHGSGATPEKSPFKSSEIVERKSYNFRNVSKKTKKPSSSDASERLSNFDDDISNCGSEYLPKPSDFSDSEGDPSYDSSKQISDVKSLYPVEKIINITGEKENSKFNVIEPAKTNVYSAAENMKVISDMEKKAVATFHDKNNKQLIVYVTESAFNSMKKHLRPMNSVSKDMVASDDDEDISSTSTVSKSSFSKTPDESIHLKQNVSTSIQDSSVDQATHSVTSTTKTSTAVYSDTEKSVAETLQMLSLGNVWDMENVTPSDKTEVSEAKHNSAIKDGGNEIVDDFMKPEIHEKAITSLTEKNIYKVIEAENNLIEALVGNINKEAALIENANRAETLKELKCDVCDKMFKKKSLLIIHMRIHTGEKPFTCVYCEKRFNTKSYKDRHEENHVNGHKNFKCDKCGKSMSNKYYFQKHMQMHLEGNSHQCVYCEMKFNSVEQLKVHLFHHTGESEFKCKKCDKSFSKELYLARHKYFKHENIKPLECEFCDKCFIRKSDLDKHLLSHVGAKPFNCPTCPKTFAAKDSLKLHLLTHIEEKSFTCHKCSQVFCLRDHLIEHVYEFHPTTVDQFFLEEQTLNVNPTGVLQEDDLCDNITKLLGFLIQEPTLVEYGWPERPIDEILEDVIRHCGHHPVSGNHLSFMNRIRKNVKLLISIVVDDKRVRSLLKSQSIDEVVSYVVKLVDSLH